MNSFIPKYLFITENQSTRDVITAEQWNNLFNLLIAQGDHNADALDSIINTDLMPVGAHILNSAGVDLGKPKYLKFLNVVTEGDDETITVAAMQGIQGIQGVQGIQGLKGDTGATGATGPAGTNGTNGINGTNGTNGLDGTSFTVKGLYATIGALQTAHPTGVAGDAYAVGTSGSNVIYIWSAAGTSWVSLGSLQGPQGIQGIQGVQGPAGTPGAAGATGATGATGAAGPAGIQGIQGIQGVAGAQGATGPAGPGLPVSGTVGQLIKKNSATNYDTVWFTPDYAAIVHTHAIANITSLQASLDAKLGSTATAVNATKWNGRQVFQSSTAPTSGMVSGDIWFKPAT